MEKDNNKPNKKDGYSISNTTIVILIILCLLWISGISLLRNHNDKVTKELGRAWLNEHPELLDKYKGNLNNYTSPDGIISFQYPSDWEVDIASSEPLMIEVSHSTLDKVVFIGHTENNDFDIDKSMEQTELLLKSTYEDLKMESGPIDCTINNYPAIRKNYTFTYTGEKTKSYASLVYLKATDRLAILIESAPTPKELKNGFATIEKTISINELSGNIEKMRQIYNLLSEAYDLSQTFEEVKTKWQQSPESRRKAYDLLNEAYVLDQSYEEFEKALMTPITISNQ